MYEVIRTKEITVDCVKVNIAVQMVAHLISQRVLLKNIKVFGNFTIFRTAPMVFSGTFKTLKSILVDFFFETADIDRKQIIEEIREVTVPFIVDTSSVLDVVVIKEKTPAIHIVTVANVQINSLVKINADLVYVI